MSVALLQDLIVALVALGAATIVVRRVVGFASTETSPTCSNCASAACTPASAPTPPGDASGPAAHPLVFVRSSPSPR